MKLKLVVASMSVLGLVSCPVFAANHTKHKHHHRVKHQQVTEVAQRDYKDMGGLVAPVAEACTISQSSMIMDEMTQNIGRSMPNACNPGWFNRIQISGGMNFDLGKFGNRNGNYMGENYQRFSLNDAYLNVGATVNDWAKAFASISYNTASINGPSTSTGYHNGEYSAAYSNNVLSGSSSTFQLEQAYATFGNFDMSPVFLQVGKQFQDFGRYTIHPITRSMTQVLSETLATSLKLGFIANGFSGSIAAFDDPMPKTGQTSRPTNYVAALGFEMPSDAVGFDLGVGYIYNMIGVNEVAYEVNQFNINNSAVQNSQGYNTRAGAVSVYGDINSGPFVLSGRYVAAVQRFNVNDLTKNGIADLINGVPATSATGAKPWAAGVQAAYGFDAWGRNQSIYAGYQASREAAGLNLPKARWLVGYTVDVFGKNTNVGIEWDHDQAYSSSNGGIPSHNTNLVSVRSSVQFG